MRPTTFKRRTHVCGVDQQEGVGVKHTDVMWVCAAATLLRGEMLAISATSSDVLLIFLVANTAR